MLNLTLGINRKLDAINAVLDAIGTVGINSDEEIDWNMDASMADKLIDRISQKIQSNNDKGWWFNREEFHKFTPEKKTGYVQVPNNTLACYIKRHDGKVNAVSMRDNLLFDAKELGYDMRNATKGDDKVHCILVVNLGFDTLPSVAKHAVADAACFWAVNNTEADRTKMESYKNASDTSIIALQSADASQKRRNMFNNARVRSDLSMIRGYNVNP